MRSLLHSEPRAVEWQAHTFIHEQGVGGQRDSGWALPAPFLLLPYALSGAHLCPLKFTC